MRVQVLRNFEDEHWAQETAWFPVIGVRHRRILVIAIGN